MSENEWALFSPREKEVVYFMSRGHGNIGIADNMKIAPRTVDRHLTRMRRRVGLTHRVGWNERILLVRWYIAKFGLQGTAGAPDVKKGR